MRTLIPHLAATVVACLLFTPTDASAQVVTIYESASRGPGNQIGETLNSGNWLGVRFSTTEEYQITTIGAHAGGGTLFFAVFHQSDAEPGDPTDLDNAMFWTTDTAPARSADVRVDTTNLNWVLPAGDWAIVVGSLGTVSQGFLATTNTEIGVPVYVRGNVTSFTSTASGLRVRFFLEGELGNCGNGTVDAGEFCDTAGDSATCDADCTAPSCGDGYVNAAASEECDDADVIETDACLSTCLSARCGDGFVWSGQESCDDGAANSDTAPNACRSDCTPPACGDGVVDSGEQCDDGNFSNTDSCLNTCMLAACGDGFVHAGVEDCDTSGETVVCNADCSAASCGDGVVNAAAGESCDDGGESATCNANCSVAMCPDGVHNQTAGEACDTNGESASCDDDCTAVVCGDRNVNQAAGEGCDDGNSDDNDGCRNSCVSGSCGDGEVQAGFEECDNGPANSATAPDACRPITCLLPTCGDGVIDSNEECDNAASNSDLTPNACRLDCRLPACGDGVVDSAEECDDGNLSNSDLCLNDCRAPFCGDGFRQPWEQCDDGNDREDDTCTTSCTRPPCGNGLPDEGEACDDGNVSNQDDCLNSCRAAVCGDGYQHKLLEECDDGNQRTGDGCTPDCEREADPDIRDGRPQDLPTNAEGGGCAAAPAGRAKMEPWKLALWIVLFGVARSRGRRRRTGSA